MMKELRSKNLDTQKEVAEDELVWVDALLSPYLITWALKIISGF
jgi:hypothetical protein